MFPIAKGIAELHTRTIYMLHGDSTRSVRTRLLMHWPDTVQGAPFGALPIVQHVMAVARYHTHAFSMENQCLRQGDRETAISFSQVVLMQAFYRV